VHFHASVKGLLMSVATDHALATIASILDKPESAHRPDKQAHIGKPAELAQNGHAAAPTPLTSPPPTPVGYCKSGPGPMAALRFKWTVRRGDDGYYVDETIAAGSVPLTSGPMSGDAAIRFVDARATDAQQRYEALKSEMTGQRPPMPILLPGVSET
jgi:hypothetical protein